MQRVRTRAGALEQAATVVPADANPCADEVFRPWAETMPAAEPTLADPPAPQAAPAALRDGLFSSVVVALRKVFRR
jgi:hypothetical protein